VRERKAVARPAERFWVVAGGPIFLVYLNEKVTLIHACIHHSREFSYFNHYSCGDNCL
jgi:hypothetical protein